MSMGDPTDRLGGAAGLGRSLHGDWLGNTVHAWRGILDTDQLGSGSMRGMLGTDWPGSWSMEGGSWVLTDSAHGVDNGH